jgi:poly(glycerol-phosphate) alpha-glucosyltransferase
VGPFPAVIKIRASSKMRIGLLSAWASRSGGGVFEAVVGHGNMIAAQGDEPVLFALEDEYSAADRSRFPGDVHVFPVRGPRMVGVAPGLVGALHAAELDALHLHGIWMYPSRAGASWAERSQKPYVISPHGMLDPWIVGRGRLKKAVARAAYERRSWRAASRFHALTESEAADIKRETGRDAVVVPNALAPVSQSPVESRARMMLAISRIHPKKNLSGLVNGWHLSQARSAGWELVIAGWGDDEHVAELERAIAGLASPSIRFVGPVFGAEKAALFAKARYFLLPSFSEGLPLAILEAWAAGVPTIQSAGCNLPQGFELGAALETGTAPSAIAEAIDKAATLPGDQYEMMANNASQLIRSGFSPEVVGRRWAAIYRGQPGDHDAAGRA